MNCLAFIYANAFILMMFPGHLSVVSSMYKHFSTGLKRFVCLLKILCTMYYIYKICCTMYYIYKICCCC